MYYMGFILIFKYMIGNTFIFLLGKDTQRVLYTKTKVFDRVTFCALQGKYPLTLFSTLFISGTWPTFS